MPRPEDDYFMPHKCWLKYKYCTWLKSNGNCYKAYVECVLGKKKDKDSIPTNALNIAPESK